MQPLPKKKQTFAQTDAGKRTIRYIKCAETPAKQESTISQLSSRDTHYLKFITYQPLALWAARRSDTHI